MRTMLCCALLLLIPVLTANEPLPPAGIEGFIKGDSLAALPGVTVGVDGLATGVHKQAVSNTSGYYLISDLNPGSYSIWAEAQGYGCIIFPRVAVFPNQRIRQDFEFAHAKKKAGACDPPAKK